MIVDATGRSKDGNKKKSGAYDSKGKPVAKGEPTKVEVTVKTPCQEAIEAAVVAAMDAHIHVSLNFIETAIVCTHQSDIKLT